MPLVSIRQYARDKGVSHTAVQKRVKHGKIRLIDGKIDPAKADADWEQNRDELQQQRGARSTGKPKAQPPVASAERKPPARESQQDGKSLPEAQRMREWLRVKREKLLLDKLDGTLVDADEVKAQTEARFRNDAEALLNWPARVVADIAAELGTDEHQTHAVLDRHVRQFMRERSMAGAANA